MAATAGGIGVRKPPLLISASRRRRGVLQWQRSMAAIVNVYTLGKEMRFTCESNTKFCHPAQHAPPFSSEERHGVLTSRTSFVMPLSMHRQSAAKSGMAPCRGSMLLACLLALVLPGAAQCPASWVTAPTSFRFSVSVSNDTALLAAMDDPQVDGILVDRDIYLGELRARGTTGALQP